MKSLTTQGEFNQKNEWKIDNMNTPKLRMSTETSKLGKIENKDVMVQKNENVIVKAMEEFPENLKQHLKSDRHFNKEYDTRKWSNNERNAGMNGKGNINVNENTFK